MTSSQKINPPLLGVDWGKRRIGISFSPDGLHVFPRKMLEVDSETEGLKSVIEEIKQEHIATLVLGLPLTMRGEIGDMAAYVKKIGKTIAQTSGIPVAYVDERGTTKQAEALQHVKMTHSKDSMAAMYVLETYINQTQP